MEMLYSNSISLLFLTKLKNDNKRAFIALLKLYAAATNSMLWRHLSLLYKSCDLSDNLISNYCCPIYAERANQKMEFLRSGDNGQNYAHVLCRLR